MNCLNTIGAGINLKKKNKVWSNFGFTGFGIVECIYALDSTHIYIAGNFDTIAGVANTMNVAMWNGSQWTALSGGVSSSLLTVYATSPNHVYVGGSGSPGSFRKYNGTIWTIIVQSSVYAMHGLNNQNIYIGGSVKINGVTQYFAHYNGDTNVFTACGKGVNDTVSSVHALDLNHIYVAGQFTSVNNVANINGVAMWTGSTWVTIGNTTNFVYNSIYPKCIYAYDSNNVYITGLSNNFTSTILYQTRYWNGTNWSKIGNISTSSGDVYAGDTSNVYITSKDGLSKWNGSSHYFVKTGRFGAIAMYNDNIYVYQWDSPYKILIYS